MRGTEGSLERRRLGLALAFALGVHALLLALLPGLPPASERSVITQPIIVELRDTPAPLLVLPETTLPQRPATRPARKRAGAQRAAGPTPSQLPETSIPTEEESAPSPEIDLFDVDALAGGLAVPGGSAKQTEGAFEGNSPEQERARVTARVEGEIGDAQAEARVRNGLVDPWFRQMAGHFREAWQPTASQVDGSGSGVGGHLRSFVGHWQAAGEQFAATGSPFPEGERPSGPNVRPPDLRPGNGLSGFDVEDFRIRWNDGQFAAMGAIVLVRLEQDGTGVPLRVEILQSSGSASLDGSARDTVRGLAGRVPAPAHGLGLGTPVIRSVWRFHARVVSNTCTPVLDQTGQGVGSLAGVVGLGCGGTFDLATGEAQAQLPFARRVMSTVELVALYGGELLPFEAGAGKGAR